MDNQFEKQILIALEQINFKLDRQDDTLKIHGERLKNLEETQRLQSETLRLQSETLKEQTSLISSLKNGQESLQAELSQLRLQNAKEFGEIKEQLKSMEDNIDLLKEETWQNKKDIRRIQKTMGMC